MKWIKASEDLPDKVKFYNCRFEGTPIVYWIDKKNDSIVLKGELMDKSIWNKIEWLDESTPTVPAYVEVLASECIDFADYILKESILPRDTNWFDAGKHLSSAQLYEQYSGSAPSKDKREIASEAFDAGFEHGMDVICSSDAGEKTTTPNKEQYLNSIL